MTETLRQRFDALLEDAPPLRIDFAAVVDDGRRLRRRRRVLVGVGSVAAAATVAAIAVPLALSAGGATSVDTVAVQPFAMTGAAAPQLARGEESLTAGQQAIADAVVASSPDGWTFDFAADRWDGLGVEATADDGSGAGRLMIGLSQPGYQLLHPCQDPEFHAGVKCTERTLGDGSVLSMRAVVDSHGVQYADVALTHPDGSGTMAETGNFVITWPLPRYISSAQDKRDLLQVTRAEPPYTVDQLAKVVLAGDRATS
jgi:hypothetical protein